MSSLAQGLRIGVVGVGRIGSMHTELLSTRVDAATVSCVFDTDGEKARDVAADLGHARAASRVEELVAADDVDAVAICSSTDTHVDLIVAAAAAGKAIFCEKPISHDLAEVDRALAAVEEAGVTMMIGFNRRFDAGHASVRDAVASGAIGDVHLLRITSRDPEPPPQSYRRVPGGIFLDMTIHDFDMARFVTGSEVEAVYALGEVRLDPVFAAEGDIDTAMVMLRHADGALTTIDNSRRSVYGYDQRVEAFGSAGMASSGNQPVHGGTLWTEQGSRGARLPTFFLERYIGSYVAEWNAFVHAIREDAPSPVPGVDGRAPLAIGLAAWRSVREGRPVGVDEIG